MSSGFHPFRCAKLLSASLMPAETSSSCAQGATSSLERLASLLHSSAMMSPIWARALAQQLQQDHQQQQAASFAEQQALQAALLQGPAAAPANPAGPPGRPAPENAACALAQGNGCGHAHIMMCAVSHVTQKATYVT